MGTSLAAAACAIAYDRSVTSQEGTWKPRQRKHPRYLRPWRTGVGLLLVHHFFLLTMIRRSGGHHGLPEPHDDRVAARSDWGEPIDLAVCGI